MKHHTVEKVPKDSCFVCPLLTPSNNNPYLSSNGFFKKCIWMRIPNLGQILCFANFLKIIYNYIELNSVLQVFFAVSQFGPQEGVLVSQQDLHPFAGRKQLRGSEVKTEILGHS